MGFVTNDSMGKSLRAVRDHLGVNLSELSRRSGVHKSNLSRIEAGKTTVSMGTLQKIAASFSMNVSDLVTIMESDASTEISERTSSSQLRPATSHDLKHYDVPPRRLSKFRHYIVVSSEIHPLLHPGDLLSVDLTRKLGDDELVIVSTQLTARLYHRRAATAGVTLTGMELDSAPVPENLILDEFHEGGAVVNIQRRPQAESDRSKTTKK